jgi:hypothetical protein
VIHGWSIRTGASSSKGGKPKDWLATLSVLAEATDDNVAAARRSLQQANPEDFETSGRVWTDRGSGQRYRLVHSQPLASPKPDKIADIFLVRDGYLVFLVRENRDDAETAELGAVGGRQASGRSHEQRRLRLARNRRQRELYGPAHLRRRQHFERRIEAGLAHRSARAVVVGSAQTSCGISVTTM